MRLVKRSGGNSGAVEGEFHASRWHPNDVPSDSGVDAWRRGSLPCSRRIPSTRKYMVRRDHRPPFVVPVGTGAKIKRHRLTVPMIFAKTEECIEFAKKQSLSKTKYVLDKQLSILFIYKKLF